MSLKKSILPIIIWCILLIVLSAFDMLRELVPVRSEGSLIILKMVRLPRILTAIIAGGGLAIAGAQMQSILRNPLADPHIMGISSGASLGAALATLAGGGLAASGGILLGMSVAMASIMGAAAASLVIMAASARFRRASTLLVFGVMLSFIVNAIITVLQSGSDAESLKIFHSWSAGSFSTTSIREIGIMAIALALGGAMALSDSKGLDIILFGDEFASLSGARPQKIRINALLSCCLMTGTVTAFCGPIGFVGIVAPHLARTFWRTSAHRHIIPASFLCGSTLGIAADLFSQITSAPVPVSSTMALVGIPIILYILIKRTEYR